MPAAAAAVPPAPDPNAAGPGAGWLERRFQLTARGSSVRTELVGGATTFATMAYILVVNPAILAFAGLPVGPSTVATAVAAIFGTVLMGIYANRPFAVAPYMGENAFIAFGLAALGITLEQRLGAVFLSGILFLAITLLGIRGWLASAISPSLKHCFAIGIGLFLALLGLYETGVVRSFAAGMPAAALAAPDGTLRNPDVPMKIGDLAAPETLLAIGGFVLIAALLQRRVRGAVLYGIAATAVVGALLGHGSAPHGIVALPFTGDYSLAPIAGRLDVTGMLAPNLLPVLLTLFLMGFLDTLGTLVALGAASGELDAKGDLPDIKRPMVVDAATCIVSGLVGTSTSGAYIESAAGIRDGARTGLASLATGGLFALSLFFLPLVEPLQRMRYAYAPALVAVGILMVGAARHVAWDDLTEVVPGIATVLMIVFTYNIANGVTAGLLLAPVAKTLAGRVREVKPGAWVLAAMSLAYYVWGLPH